MAELINLKTFKDNRGNLTVIENLPFPVKRIFYIYGVDHSLRGGHRHKITKQIAICLQGSCKIYNNDNETEDIFVLNAPDQCLLLQPRDWHEMYDFSDDAILMILASSIFDKEDYIHSPYRTKMRPAFEKLIDR